MSDNTDFETALNSYDYLEANLPKHLVKHLDIIGKYLNEVTEKNDSLARRHIAFQGMFEQNKYNLLQTGYEKAVDTIVTDGADKEFYKMSSPYMDPLIESMAPKTGH